jgi:hypothetical protein
MSTIDLGRTKRNRCAAGAPRVIGAVALAIVATSTALAADPPAAPAAPPKEAPATTDDAPPSLDELLGIDEEGGEGASAAEVADRAAQEELQQRLDEEEIRNAFAEAVHKMAVAAEQLDEHFDTGLGTQRLQEEILARLDELVSEAKKQQSRGGGGSSATSAARSSTPAPAGRKAPSQPGAPQPASDSRDETERASEPPPGQPNTIFEEARTEWGNLPERVRDMLLQGRREKFSSLYERLTREYYRRLAEED